MIAFIRKLLRLSRPYSQRLALGVLMGLLAGVMEPALIFCVQFAIRVTFPTANAVSASKSQAWIEQHLSWLAHWLPGSGGSVGDANKALVVLMIPLVMLLRGLFSYLNLYFLQWVSIRTITDLRVKIFTHLMSMPLAILNKISTGELISRIVNDTATLQNTISNSLVVLIKDPTTLIGLIIFLLWNQPMLTIVSLIVFPLCLIPITIYSRKVRQSSIVIQNQYAELSKIMHESFTGGRIIKAYNLEKTVVGQFSAASSKFISHYMRVVRSAEIPGPLIEFFSAVGVSAIFYYILLVSHKPIDSADFFGFVLGIFACISPLKHSAVSIPRSDRRKPPASGCSNCSKRYQRCPNRSPRFRSRPLARRSNLIPSLSTTTKNRCCGISISQSKPARWSRWSGTVVRVKQR